MNDDLDEEQLRETCDDLLAQRTVLQVKVKQLELQNRELRADIDKFNTAMMETLAERDKANRLNASMQKVVDAAMGLHEATKCEHGGRIWSSRAEDAADVLFKALGEMRSSERPNRETCRAPLPGGARCAFFMPCPDHGGRGDLSRACKVHNNQDCEMCAEKRIHLTPVEYPAEQRACQHYAATLNSDVCPTCGTKFGAGQ